MMPLTYLGEAPGSAVIRLATRGRLAPEIAEAAMRNPLSISPLVFSTMIGIGVSEPALKELRAEITSFLPFRTLNDLHRPVNLDERIGKGCEACLSEDADEGRDHYLRAD